MSASAKARKAEYRVRMQFDMDNPAHVRVYEYLEGRSNRARAEAIISALSAMLDERELFISPSILETMEKAFIKIIGDHSLGLTLNGGQQRASLAVDNEIQTLEIGDERPLPEALAFLSSL